MENSSATLKIGSQLNEFNIQQVLGAGTFGVTYLAQDNYLDKQVVIKEYFPNDIAIRADASTVFSKSDHDQDSFKYGLESFMKEAKILAKFDHPNVVRVKSFFEANNTAYFVMDYEKGQDLEEYLQKNSQLSENQILNIIIPLLDGLREVHGKSYLHRDIKPANIYIKSNGNPMLIDFGATRYSIGAKSQSLSVILTPGYAPKEQYNSRSKQEAYTDIYAIGAVMYKMLTEASPIEASERSDIITNDEPDPHIRLMEMNYPNYSEHFKSAIDWALEFKPKDRPQSIKELQKALEGIHDDEKEIQPLIPTTIKIKEKEPLKTRKEDREKKSNFLGMIGSIVVAIAVTITSVNYYNDAQDRDEKKIAKDKKEQEAKKELGESIDRGSYIKPALVHIEGGSYSMGSDKGDSDEKPVHQVTINYDFEIGKYEVSIAEYKKCVDDGGCKQVEWLEKGSSYNIHTGTDDYYKKMCLKDNCPAIGVSWHNAKAYTKWLSQKTGKNYRLPTEAEWELVARAGTQSKWSFGDSKSNLKSYAWYDENSYDLGEGHKDYRTHEVGTKKANRWGVYDMHGNVWEWCEDWYLDSYNETPKDGSVNQSQNENRKVLRGGSWYYSAYDARSANRNRDNPTYRNFNFGFRLQRTLP